MNAVFYGFQFPQHGRFSAFSALTREFAESSVSVCKLAFPNTPKWLPGRVRGGWANKWYQLNEYRLRFAFNKGATVHYFFPENTLFKASQWKRNGKLVLSCHQPIKELMSSPWMQKRTEFFEGLKAAEIVVLMASCEIEEYRKLAPNSEVLCIPHGVDTDYFSPAQALQVNAGAERFRVLTVGNWLRDYDQWAEVVKKVAGEMPCVEFTVIAGEKTHAKIRETMGAYKKNIRLLCGISDEALRDEYNQADVVFLPLTDAWANNALLESMSCGRPLLVTDLPATREYAGEAAVFVSKNDLDAAAHSLLELRIHPEVREILGTQARIRMETKYGWEQVAQTHLDLYAGPL